MIDNEVFRNSITCAPLTNSVVVQAGPGSGKTKILIERLKYIIQNRPQSLSGIACITYTNVAKDEIITRLQNEGFQLPKDLFIGTIHSFLLDYIIKPYSHFASEKKEPYKLASFGFSRRFKREIGEILNSPTHFIREKTYMAFESLGRDEEGEPFCFQKQIAPEVARKWKDVTKKEGYIDQQDVIYLSYLILNKYEHIRNAFSSRFPYILVDEYQDVTFYQDKVFGLLERTKFFYVGDRNQSIYSFTGAKPEILQAKLTDEYYSSYTLSNNFRSTKHIVKFANHKTEIVQLELGLNASSEQMVIFITDIKEDLEVLKLFNQIREEIECEYLYNPYMILARGNDYLKRIGFLLKDESIESKPFLQKLKKESYRRFQILENLLLAISYKRRNEYDQAVEKMSETFSYLFFNEHPNFVSLSEIGFDRFMWKKLQVFTLSFLDNLVLTEISVASLFLQVKEFLSSQSKKLYNKSIGRKILMLNYKWKNQSIAAKNTMVSHLVEQIELQNNLSESEGHLFSIHGSKGQEAECVLVMAESESQLTEWLAENESSEEARVGYVAFSRARKLLCVWAPSIKEENYLHLKNHVKFVDSSYTTEIESI